jgi:hypothetical protein
MTGDSTVFNCILLIPYTNNMYSKFISTVGLVLWNCSVPWNSGVIGAQCAGSNKLKLSSCWTFIFHVINVLLLLCKLKLIVIVIVGYLIVIA